VIERMSSYKSPQSLIEYFGRQSGLESRESMELARRYLIRGHVQGVGYRYFTQRIAVRLGVRGWVRNRPDGDVEVHAQASATVLQSFRAELESGPRSSDVREVLEQPLELGPFSSFDIR